MIRWECMSRDGRWWRLYEGGTMLGAVMRVACGMYGVWVGCMRESMSAVSFDLNGHMTDAARALMKRVALMAGVK